MFFVIFKPLPLVAPQHTHTLTPCVCVCVCVCLCISCFCASCLWLYVYVGVCVCVYVYASALFWCVHVFVLHMKSFVIVCFKNMLYVWHLYYYLYCFITVQIRLSLNFSETTDVRVSVSFYFCVCACAWLQISKPTKEEVLNKACVICHCIFPLFKNPPRPFFYRSHLSQQRLVPHLSSHLFSIL